MSTLKPAYGSSTAITWTSAATLASGSASGCAAIDNTSNLYVDLMVTILATLASGTPTAGGAVYVYVAATEDGSTWTGTNAASLDNYTGSDAAVTLQSPSVFAGPFTIPTPNGGLLARKVIPSIARLAGGVLLPRKIGLIAQNSTGLAFTAFSATYSGLQYQSS